MSLLLNGSKTITIAGTEMQCIEIYTGENEDYWVLSPQQRYYVYMAGVIAGFFPIAVFSSIHGFYLLLLAPYVLGLTSDVENIIRSIKQMHAANKKKSLQQVKTP